MPRIWDSKDPGKTGGKGYGKDPDIRDDQGPLTCGRCGGMGKITREVKSKDGGSDFDEMDCPTCGGEGQVS
jgi:DnaJ-class molecular chaperone